MSRVDELIAQFAPHGVKSRPLASLGTRNKGTSITAAKMKTLALVPGPLRVFAGGQTIADVAEDAVPAKDVVRVPSIIVKSRGHIGFVYYEKPFTHKSELWSYSIDDAEVDQKFVYYYLMTQVRGLQELARATSVKLPQLGVRDTDELRIPIPPLEVQREIVEILDRFTRLEAELEAELEGRRRQYEHYRHIAMSFDESIPRVSLGDIAEVRSGWGFPNAHQGQVEGEYPFYKVSYMNLHGSETVMSVANHYVSAEVAKKLGVRLAPAGTVIFPKIGAAVATNKKRVLSVPSAYDNNVMGLVPNERVTSRFLYHWMQTFDLSSLANDSGAVPSIRKSEAEQVLVPLPDLDVQRSVADLLDKFDALVNDLSVGLPAELNARRKQYEYYRDKLLTFEEAAA